MKTRCPNLPFSIEKEACLECGEEMSEKYRRCNPALRDTVEAEKPKKKKKKKGGVK